MTVATYCEAPDLRFWHRKYLMFMLACNCSEQPFKNG